MKSETIQLAVCVPLTGLADRLGLEMKQAIELAVNERNIQGGIAGLPLRLSVFDDESKVTKAETIAKTISGDPSMVAVIGHYGSDTSLAGAKIFEKSGLPLIAPIASNPKLTESRLSNVFRYTNRDDRTAAAISKYLVQQLKKQRAVIIRSETAYGHSMAGEFQKAFRHDGGQVLADIVVEEGRKTFSDVIAALPSDFDMVFYGGTFEGAPVLKALRSAGKNQLMATGDGCWDAINFLAPAGHSAEQGEGVLVMSASSAVGDCPGSMEFCRKYEKLHGRIINYALNAYDAACLVLAAIDTAVAQAGRSVPARSEVVAAMRQIRFSGTANSNSLQWDEKGDHSATITRLNTVGKGKFKEITLF